MTTITLDFSSSYRAITDADILPSLIRDVYGFDGLGQPEGAVTLITSHGEVLNVPARNLLDGIPAFFLAHSPRNNQFDLINSDDETVLRFAFPVDPAPIYENYVEPLYTGDAGILKFNADEAVWTVA